MLIVVLDFIARMANALRMKILLLGLVLIVMIVLLDNHA